MSFENYLQDNGTFLVKICLEAAPGALERFADEYRPTTSLNTTYLSVDHVDRVKYAAVMGWLMRKTECACPWDRVRIAGLKPTVEETVGVIARRLEGCVENGIPRPGCERVRAEYPNPREGLDPHEKSKGLIDRAGKLGEELGRLQILLALSGRSLVCCFEGWDAAGKGGCIRHLCHALNPRGYRVAQVKRPTPEAYDHTYLWRFAGMLPGPGRIAVFDRSWYGRMMVEPIEGFCSEEEYQRSAAEINAFESILSESGCVVLKFWLEIDKDTQKERFEDRQNDPLKSWKLTEEDWRNRGKWDEYSVYVDRMISATNTPWAPWAVIPSGSKKHAQAKVMEAVVEALRKELGN